MCVCVRERERLKGAIEMEAKEIDDELKNFVKVWALATAALCYCYYIAARIPRGIPRLLSLQPVFYLFIVLPLNLTFSHLAGTTSFFLVWLATFNLLLFSFDQGPLISPPPSNVLHFISLACLPIKLQQNPSKTQTKNVNENPPELFLPRPVLLAIKAVLLVMIFHSYNYKHDMHPKVVLFLYCLHLYLELEIVLAICATPARALLGFELEPQFNEPYLATSLQDFWGRRWNLLVTSILRPTVYHPVRQLSKAVVGREWAPLPGVVATFVVSGLMHELIYFYLTRVSPTWEVTWFFALQGVSVAIEMVAKKMVAHRWQLHRVASGPLTLIFVATTGVWLFFPQLINNGVDDKVIAEYSKLAIFVKDKLFRLIISHKSS